MTSQRYRRAADRFPRKTLDHQRSDALLQFGGERIGQLGLAACDSRIEPEQKIAGVVGAVLPVGGKSPGELVRGGIAGCQSESRRLEHGQRASSEKTPAAYRETTPPYECPQR